jgi:hypothetical protein
MQKRVLVFSYAKSLIYKNYVPRGTRAFDDDIVEALGKFMNVFNKKMVKKIHC